MGRGTLTPLSPDLQPTSHLDHELTLPLELQHRPLLEYSALYAGIHEKKYFLNSAVLLGLKLLDDCNSHISTKTILRTRKRYVYPMYFDNIS